MTLMEAGYRERLVDKQISDYQQIFGAVVIEGPKWCGKTWTGLSHARDVCYLSRKSERDYCRAEPSYVFSKEKPLLIDEWQLVPRLWDEIRLQCDITGHTGDYILTGSTTLDSPAADEIKHSGTGRFAFIHMRPMSLYESGDSTGRASITQMRDGILPGGPINAITLAHLAELAVRGGWPRNLSAPHNLLGAIPKQYLEAVIMKDIHERTDRRRDSRRMRMLIRSLARNESTVASISTITKDILDHDRNEHFLDDRRNVEDYLSVLDSLFLTDDQPAYSLNYRSSARVGRSVKRHLADPSLVCAALNLSPEKLLADHHTFGLVYESLVERDLRIYAEALGGTLYHFRDNTSGDEVDAIIEFADEDYAAFEIKLSDASVDEAKASLMRFYDAAVVKPSFMCIVVGNGSAIIRDADTGIYIVPAAELGV